MVAEDFVFVESRSSSTTMSAMLLHRMFSEEGKTLPMCVSRAIYKARRRRAVVKHVKRGQPLAEIAVPLGNVLRYLPIATKEVQQSRYLTFPPTSSDDTTWKYFSLRALVIESCKCNVHVMSETTDGSLKMTSLLHGIVPC